MIPLKKTELTITAKATGEADSGRKLRTKGEGGIKVMGCGSGGVRWTDILNCDCLDCLGLC
jgi:hypothetical protein